MLTCLENLIGITQTENECIVKGLSDTEKAYLKKSKSGLYLDDLQGGVHMRAIKEIDSTKPFLELATTAINNAIQTLGDDLEINLATRYEDNNHRFLGTIGHTAWAVSLNTSRRWQGFKIMPTALTDASVKITGIKCILNEGGIFLIRVLKVRPGSVMGEEIKSYPVEAVANQFFTVQMAEPLELPLNVRGQIFEYWVIYDRYDVT